MSDVADVLERAAELADRVEGAISSLRGIGCNGIQNTLAKAAVALRSSDPIDGDLADEVREQTAYAHYWQRSRPWVYALLSEIDIAFHADCPMCSNRIDADTGICRSCKEAVA